MFSKKEYEEFTSELIPIIEDTYEQNPTEDEMKRGVYHYRAGFWPTTKDFAYFYHKDKISAHRDKLLSMCKRLPKFCAATNEHAGAVSSFDLLPVVDILENESQNELMQQMIFAEHFANLVCGAGIATVQDATHGELEGFLIVFDKKYGSYFAGNDR